MGFQVSEDSLNGKVFLKRRFGVLVQFMQHAIQVGGLAIDQELETPVQLVRRTRMICQMMLQLVLAALGVALELRQVRA